MTLVLENVKNKTNGIIIEAGVYYSFIGSDIIKKQLIIIY